MMRVFKNFIFDLDGTLVDSSGDVIACLNNAYQKHPEISHLTINNNIIGPPLSELIERLTPNISEKDAEIITKEFRTCYDNCTYEKTILYDDVFDFIHYLKKCQYRLFIATNKPQIATTRIIQSLDINIFDEIVTLDSLSGKRLSKEEMISYLIKKWSLSLDHTVMVGDDASDIIAARNNKIRSVAIRNGYGDNESLHNAKPSFSFSTIGDFWKAVKELIP